MDRSGGCRLPAPAPDLLDQLKDAFRCLHTGSRPVHSGPQAAAALSSGLRGLSGGRELTYCSLSLLEKMCSSLTSSSRSLAAEAASHWETILRELLQDPELMAQLVHHFQDGDQMLSHLAAKSVSACVIYHLQQTGTVIPVWEQKCVQAFHNSGPGMELDACLWSLADVLKKLVRGDQQEALMKLLAAFNSSLSELCSELLPEDITASTHSRRWGITFCLFLDLLEVLTASGSICQAAMCLSSQRLTHTHSPALLAVVGCSSVEYFVKRRAALLLKRAALQKAGEDWAVGALPPARGKHEQLSPDSSTLARSVLAAVAAGWLHSIQLDSASFFGGTRCPQAERGLKPDCVMLRAVSLLLLRAAELHIQTAAATGVEPSTEVSGCLQGLWSFLQSHRVHRTEVDHRCQWLSLLFTEQDDDMMEAARALLSVFLHHRRCSGLDDAALLESACASGCNPHCHFLFLLRSIAFDHSILLDFLISTETCFLEYFVRYLKYLRVDVRGFAAACDRLDAADARPSLLTSPCASSGGDTLRQCEAEAVSGTAGLRLVDYASSDESEPEDMDPQEDAGASGCENSGLSASNANVEMKQPAVPACEFPPSKQTLSQPDPAQDCREEGEEGSSLQKVQTPVGTCETSARAMLCLSQLRELVARLHAKKLFPYNPSSLLKLLTIPAITPFNK